MGGLNGFLKGIIIIHSSRLRLCYYQLYDHDKETNIQDHPPEDCCLFSLILKCLFVKAGGNSKCRETGDSPG